MKKKLDCDLQKNIKDCKTFINYLDDGKGEEAYTLLKENHELIDELKISEIAYCYENILRFAGEKQSHYFFLRIAKRISDTLAYDIALIRKLEKTREENILKNTLNDISEKSKKILEDMADSN